MHCKKIREALPLFSLLEFVGKKVRKEKFSFFLGKSSDENRNFGEIF